MFHRILPSMWLAFSDDLTGGRWGDDAEIMWPRPGNRDGWKPGAGGPPIETDHAWLVTCHGVAQPKRSCLGVALLDLDDPRRVLHWLAAAILEPEEPWERHGDVDDVVFTCGMSERDGTYYVYFGGADTVIGVATIDRDHRPRRTDRLRPTLGAVARIVAQVGVMGSRLLRQSGDCSDRPARIASIRWMSSGRSSRTVVQISRSLMSA